MEDNNYNAASVRAFINKMKPNPERLAKGIDTNQHLDLKPVLQCAFPCFTCTENDPAFCTSCWGPGPDNSNKLVFLQRSGGKSTCKSACDDKFSANGNIITRNNDKSTTYLACEDCDFTCNSCKAQN